MNLKLQPSLEASVSSLEDEPPSPNGERISAMRLHYLRQAVSTSEPAAILCLSVSALGQLNVTALGIEPEHANLMLDKLDHLKNKLQAFIDQQQKSNTHTSAQVIDLRR